MCQDQGQDKASKEAENHHASAASFEAQASTGQNFVAKSKARQREDDSKQSLE